MLWVFIVALTALLTITLIAIIAMATREEQRLQSEAFARESAAAMEAAALLEEEEEESFVDMFMNPIQIMWEPPRDLDY
ncbi:hypothetical protein EDC01DRAFT_779146 [Geopyxis carbonaria]|nr:hypothetical protein EDC01DRAFT_779146 [Geopyxis carbonaria]